MERVHGGWPTQRWCVCSKSCGAGSPWPLFPGPAACCSGAPCHPALLQQHWPRNVEGRALDWLTTLSLLYGRGLKSRDVAMDTWRTTETLPGVERAKHETGVIPEFNLPSRGCRTGTILSWDPPPGMFGAIRLEETVILWHSIQKGGVGGWEGTQQVANSSYVRVCIELDSHFFTVNVGCLKSTDPSTCNMFLFCLFVWWPLRIGSVLFVLTVVVIFICWTHCQVVVCWDVFRSCC